MGSSAAALALLLLLVACDALYEDQIGKFDWRQIRIGRPSLALFDGKRLVVATEENAIAALHAKSGGVAWRQVLEAGARGEVRALDAADEFVLSVSGRGGALLVRGWDAGSGLNLWEWSVFPREDAGDWWLHGRELLHALPAHGSHLELTRYDCRTGQNRGTSERIEAPWINKRCVLSAPFYACLTPGKNGGTQLVSVDVTSDNLRVYSENVDVTDSGDIQFSALPGKIPGVIVDGKVILLKSDGFRSTNNRLQKETVSVHTVKLNDEFILLQTHYKDESLQVTATDIETGALVSEYSNTVPLAGANSPKLTLAMCAKTSKNNLACRLLVVGEDSAVYFLQNPGKLVWTREEALSKIVGVEMLDLPVSELEAVIETEFDNKEGDIFGMFTRRLKSQFAQIKTFSYSLLHNIVPHLTSQHDDSVEENLLIRDEFGLHKLIIVVTEVGKVFGIDNLSGTIIWKRYIPFLSPFKSLNDDKHVLLYIQRTTRHLPYDAQCTIIARHKFTGEGLLFMFNPITGAGVDLGIANLGYRIKQTVLLNQINNEFLKGIVIMDENERVRVYPPSCSQYIGNATFMFVADSGTAVAQGYILKYENDHVSALNTWIIRLGGSPTSGHRITNIAIKNPMERVHSQGKVMGDRSVLYKYINPNLVAFTTEGPDPVHKDVLNLYLVDVVSGAIIMVQTHKRARGPVKIVHAENWLVYSYYSEKSRRPEIATLELYEGPVRSGGSFSSLETNRWPPEIARQAYVLPTPALPLSIATTITDRGITPKDILISLNTGAIVELPWALLDPRRPTVPMTNEMREEGLLQYIPELPLPSETVINYNQTVVNIRNMHTSPSGLESTCLVFAYGLDTFYTRVAPSKTFDLLKEDFDYTLIVLVLTALIVSTYAAKRFASRKVLRQAWK